MNSRLKSAEERLEKALARVDAAGSQSAQALALENRLAAAELENATLREQRDEIAGRLDQAIAKLQQVLKAS